MFSFNLVFIYFLYKTSEIVIFDVDLTLKENKI